MDKNINNNSFHKFLKEEEAVLESEFWDYWADVEEFAARWNLTTRYVEEEFLIDGELVQVEPELDETFYPNEYDDPLT